jgi:hypothetical protein
MVTGRWPSGDIDHINGERGDNRWRNLRDVTRSINGQNRHRAPSNNRLGILGVRARGRRFTAQITVGGRALHIGTFGTAKEAAAAHAAAKRQMHPGWAR